MKDNKGSFSTSEAIASSAKKKKILVADDDQGILDALKMLLEEVGYEVNTISDGETMRSVKNYYPDLLLLDIWMSGVDGRDICRQLKAQEKTKRIPIIMISANRDTEQIAKDAGADDFISKPFQMEELLEKVAKYVATSD
jgi:DNA-binding response OmpR family regulator